jgi:hypothetical protein
MNSPQAAATAVKPSEKPGDRQAPAVVRPAREQKGETMEDYFNAIREITQDLTYVGFSSKKFREDVKAKGINSLTVVKVISAYAQVGNNVRNCVDKRRQKVRPDIADLLKGVNERPSRFAIAFLPVLLVIRRKMKETGTLAPRFANIATDPLLQDPAFTGWLGNNLREFLLLFDRALAQTGFTNQHGPDQVTRWIEISSAGFQADKELIEAMKKADNDEAVMVWLRATLGEK